MRMVLILMTIMVILMMMILLLVMAMINMMMMITRAIKLVSPIITIWSAVTPDNTMFGCAGRDYCKSPSDSCGH